MIEPIIRILLRYGAGIVFGMEVGDALAGDPDVILVVTSAIAFLTELWWTYARRKGRAT
jgi:hypothetical protein